MNDAIVVRGRHVSDENRAAQAELRCENDLAVVPGASHMFEEPSTLATAAALARDWLTIHMTARLRFVR